jgi:hypothetical protein
LNNNGLLLSTIELPSKDIKWEEKIIYLKEQLGRCENQSRYYHRELMKYYKLLYDAGV